jgi:PPK2 family polyphosphate:nucleotide phosphotransferase
MKIDSDDFRVKDGKKVRLNKWPTKIRSYYESEDHYRELLSSHVEQLSSLQEMHYAANQHALLLIFQAMDAAGKDGVIRHVMSGINPQGCQVFSFKHPSATELDHDFLWRTTLCLPERGRIGVFNRSYYEDVLIVRVHPEILISQQIFPGKAEHKNIWKRRYESIVSHEAHLDRNGTKVVKFFLHISKEEQRQRFLSRIENADKNWKFGEADMQEREFWGDYMSAYEKCLSATSTDYAPWYVVPADDKQNARLIVSQVVLDALRSLKPEYPKTTKARATQLESIRQQLLKQGKK